jgi:hypothetical protein
LGGLKILWRIWAKSPFYGGIFIFGLDLHRERKIAHDPRMSMVSAKNIERADRWVEKDPAGALE